MQRYLRAETKAGAEWRIITPIEEAWAHLSPPEFPNYAAGSEGPTWWRDLLEGRGKNAEQALHPRQPGS
jgi:glucose-6-phosphate 1-dehydrogenase